MSSKEQSVTLLRVNKRAQVAALQAVGFSDLTNDAKASEFAKRIKWAGGLLDICLACVRKSDRHKFYFTTSEWDSLTAANKARFVFRGLRVRAYGRSFIVAASDCVNENLGTTFAWGSSGIITDVSGKYFGAAYDDFESEDNTTQIIATLGSSNDGCPAATACRNYKAFTEGEEADLDFDDDTVWSLPSLGITRLLYVLREEINAVFRSIWGQDSELKNDSYWSSTYADGSNRWYVVLASGQIYYGSTSTAMRVRPISEE